MIDAVASEIQYLHHLAPIWRALEESERGTFWVAEGLLDQARASGVEATPLGPKLPRGGLVLVASYGDELRVAPRPVVLVEHGAGQHYSTGHPSYSGGRGHRNVKLFL